MRELLERAANMRELLDKHVAAMKADQPAEARNIAFEMMGVVNGLYNAAYSAAAAQARREGRTG